MVDILVKGGIHLTMSKSGIINNGAVAIDDGKIIDVGKKSSIEAKYRADVVINASRMIVMPGIICTHCHVNSRVQIGMPVKPPAEFYERLRKFRWPMVEDQITKNDAYITAKIAAARMAIQGVTCVADLMEAPNALPGVLESEARAFPEVGIRGMLAYEVTDRQGREVGEKGLAENINFIERYNRMDGLVKGMIGAHTMFSCEKDTLLKIREEADRLKCMIHMHVEESKYEVEFSKKKYGMLPVEFLDEIGFLGPDVLAAQCVNITPREIDIFAKRNVKVSHNLLSNLGVGVGVSPVPLMIQKGVTVGLGNDGGYNLDMFEVMRACYLIYRGVLHNPIDPSKILKMATIDAARALGLEKTIGSIQPGKKADIIIIDLQSPTPVIKDNIYSQIVSQASGNVKHVIVDGRLIVKDRELTTIDYHKALAEAQENSLNFWERVGLLRGVQ